MKHIANITKAHLRPSDIFARIGGEELAILLPKTDPQMAVHLVERILDTVIATPFSYENKPISVSSSAGVAEYSGDDTLDG